MRFYVIVPLLVFLVLLRIAEAELQGPVPAARNSPNEIETTENTETDPSASATTGGSEVTTENQTSNESKETEQQSNERKSSKYAPSEKATTGAGGLDSNLQQRTKIMEAAISFERLLNGKVVREKIKQEIEAIEASRSNEAKEPEEISPELIEAQNLYEKAMGMFGQPQSDKRVVLAMLRKAADMKHLDARAELAWAHLLGVGVDLNVDFAVAEFENLAQEGVAQANMGLGFLYTVGLGGKNISQPLALLHLTLAALGDDTFAQMALGYRYSFGINVPISCERSLTYYKKVAKKVASRVKFTNGPIVHRVRLLDESENSGSHETEIVDYYQLLADKGDVQSQIGLGQLYYQGGKAIQQDHQKALEYFTQAANAGNAIGFAFLGKLYLRGSEFIKADNETAFKYFKKAADLGDPVGQSGLGLMYLHGFGVQQDSLKALNYFTQAADQGWVDGHLYLGIMYMNGYGVKKDYKLALKYFNLASQAGHVLAYYSLGIMHAYGMGMLRSCPAAVEFFKNVAERGSWSNRLMGGYNAYKSGRIDQAYLHYALLAEMGYEVAQSNAAYLLDTGDVTIFPDRHEQLIRAFYYWKRSAAQGYSAAQVKLGDYYYYGWGTDVDFETAAALYRKASEQQYNAQAMFNLGYMHEQGLGMKKDWHLAKRLYDLAAETNTDAKVPVALALFKLQLLAKVEAIKESPYKFIFYLDENISANWDLYTITVLTLLLGTIVYHRRPYQQQPQPQQQPPNPPQEGEAASATDVAAQPADNQPNQNSTEQSPSTIPQEAESSSSSNATNSSTEQPDTASASPQ